VVFEQLHAVVANEVLKKSLNLDVEFVEKPIKALDHRAHRELGSLRKSFQEVLGLLGPFGDVGDVVIALFNDDRHIVERRLGLVDEQPLARQNGVVSSTTSASARSEVLQLELLILKVGTKTELFHLVRLVRFSQWR
jgi:hypothetical protein